MWINLEKEQLQLLRSAMIVTMPTHPEAVSIVTKIDETFREAEEAGGWPAMAREIYGEDGKVEVDGDAVVSHGDDPGAYVMAWVWVTEDEMGISKECEGCFERHPVGVLEDGLCPACCDDEDQEDDEEE